MKSSNRPQTSACWQMNWDQARREPLSKKQVKKDNNEKIQAEGKA
jgi:hypothetical protein